MKWFEGLPPKLMGLFLGLGKSYIYLWPVLFERGKRKKMNRLFGKDHTNRRKVPKHCGQFSSIQMVFSKKLIHTDSIFSVECLLFTPFFLFQEKTTFSTFSKQNLQWSDWIYGGFEKKKHNRSFWKQGIASSIHMFSRRLKKSFWVFFSVSTFFFVVLWSASSIHIIFSIKLFKKGTYSQGKSKTIWINFLEKIMWIE